MLLAAYWSRERAAARSHVRSEHGLQRLTPSKVVQIWLKAAFSVCNLETGAKFELAAAD